jgi:3'(2'), 5'-bisphosphate nucleotidase
VVTAEMLTELRRLAREAGDAILAHYDGPVAVELKDDESPLTLADRDAHAVLVEGLAALAPEIPVISEEGEIPGPEARAGWRRFWLVDPLDGTKEFIKRNGEFTVNVALVEDGVPTVGVIYAPALDRLYSARLGEGAWREVESAEPERIFSREREAGRPLTIVESRSHPSPEMAEFLQGLEVGDRVEAGSSLKFCLVAEGRADVYPRLGPTMEWDVAAGDCIWRSSARAGTNPSPLTYNKPDLRNTRFVIGL